MHFESSLRPPFRPALAMPALGTPPRNSGRPCPVGVSQASHARENTELHPSPFQIFPSPQGNFALKYFQRGNLGWHGTGEEKGRRAMSMGSHFVCAVREHPFPPRKTHDRGSAGNILASPQPCQRKQLTPPWLHRTPPMDTLGQVRGPIWCLELLPSLLEWLLHASNLLALNRYSALDRAPECGKQGWNPRNLANKNDRKQQETRITKAVAPWKVGPWSEPAGGG
uniref:Uncharacterized protein n=1 Tax=Myotis myotis TaxID=51298 RepID=A0A7J8ALA4_MYOMY|nr:hypothetical protein mMyoMyo1_007832 [Myotis myotis]